MAISVLALLLWFNVYLRLAGKLKVNYILLKSYGLFISLTFTATISFYHYPACLISLLVVFPLLHNSIGLAWSSSISKTHSYSSLQKLLSHIFFLTSLIISIMLLFGTHLMDGQSGKPAPDGFNNIYRNLLQMTVEDFVCAGSNIWIYISMLYVPNLVLVAQI